MRISREFCSLIITQSKMWSYYITFGAYITLFMLKTAKTDSPKCHFLESVNITSSPRLQNGSYIYQNLEIPVNMTGQYDYTTKDMEFYETVGSHLRGCVCHLKPCIWICCRFKDWDASNGKCIDGLMEELNEINPFLEVTLSNGSKVKRNLLKDFIVLRDRMWLSDDWIEDTYTLFENGSLLLFNYDTIIVRGYGCLHPNQFTSGNSESFVVAFHTEFEKLQKLLPCERELMGLSAFFLVLTIAVYLYVRKLRNLHGKCFICYMITSVIYFINQLLKDAQKDSKICVLYGYFKYFFLIAKFNWLFAMSHQLWRGFTLVNRGDSEYSFEAYNILAWGTAAILTGVIFCFELIWDEDPSKVEWVPGVGWQECYIKLYKCGVIFVLFPMVILIVLNTILFILTTITILRVKLLMRHQDESSKNLKSKMALYKVFLRLFILMDIQWSVRMTYMIGNSDLLLTICRYCDACNGLIVFVLFVLKSSTLKLLINNIRKWRK